MAEYMAGLTEMESYTFTLLLFLGNKEIFTTKF